MFLNRCYWPDSEATGQLLMDLCIDLSEHFDVHVVCGIPNSPTTTQYVKEGIEQRQGVTIHRLSHMHFQKRIPAGRLINLVSFSRAASQYLRKTRLSCDVLVCETDPFLLPVVAAKHSKRTGCKLMCYLQDIYPDVAEAIGKVSSGWLTQTIRAKLRKAYERADRIVVLGECMKSRLSDSPWSIAAEKMHVIPNWSDCGLITPLSVHDNPFRLKHGLSDRVVVMHSGNMGLTQRLNVLIEATQCDTWPERAMLLLVGDGAAKSSLQQQANDIGTDRVKFLPYQPREKLAESFSAADLHIVSMHPNITGCLCPSKLYGILAAGRPVLAIADSQTDLCQTVRQEGLGWTCEPGQANAIADAVSQATLDDASRAAAGERARTVALAKFDRPVVTNLFKNLLNDLLDKPVTTLQDQIA
ncbi:glycosyltransferase family 4 protein [Rubripirellula amarantea]|nr:glycosyltransferase family 4 protein [Rubripirellula amarantea]